MSAVENMLKLCVAGGVSFVLVAGTALAAPRDITVTAPAPDPDVRVERVSYKDLNLVLASDQKVLNGRVGDAVRNVCEPLETGFAPDHMFCKSTAWKGARPQIARAIERARQIAATGTTSIPPVTIVLAFPGR